MIQVWCVDENGFFTESILVEEIKENMTEIPIIIGFYKAKWDGSKWIEGATNQEIQEWKDKNIVIVEPSEQEILNAQLLKENADMKAQLAEQQELTANLLLQVASLKGGSTNV